MRYRRLIISIVITLILLFLQPILVLFFESGDFETNPIFQRRNIFIILSFSWALIELVKALKRVILKQYDLSTEDNLKSRKVYTQFNVLEKVIVSVIILFAIGMIMLSFESIRKIGIGIFASAGVAGIIIGLSAQKVVGALLAGIQIAITQPFRIDDAVVVENEWGWIEEINLTYVVVRLWDKRRLVLPTNYFLEKPFQNWTRNSAEITGSIFIYTDYTIPFPALREELTRLLEESELWDRKVNVLQVTSTTESTVEIRILVSAKNSPTAWDLRVHIREKMIEFIQKNYPECLPRTRVMLKDRDSSRPKND